MSVKTMAWVWANSRSKPTQRLVLLAIADCANDHGAEAYPSTATLAGKTGLTERGVRKAIVELERLGELAVQYKNGPRGTNRYRVVMSDETRNTVPGTRNDMPGTRNVVHPEPHSGYPEPHSAYPEPHSENPERGSPEPSEPSLTIREPSEVVPAPPVQPPEQTRPEVEDLCRHLADRIEANGCKRPTITKKWRQAARLMLDTDGRTPDNIRAAIDWCQDDEFWRANILSMPKLRQRYDQLSLAARRTRAGGVNGQPRRPNVDDRFNDALAAGRRLQAQQDKQQQQQRLEIAS